MDHSNSLEFYFKKLEKIVQEMDNDKITIDESLEKFEEAVTLYKKCKGMLTKVEKKISKLNDSLKEEEIIVE